MVLNAQNAKKMSVRKKGVRKRGAAWKEEE